MDSVVERTNTQPSFLHTRTAYAIQVAVGFLLIEAALWDRRHLAPWAWLALAWIVASTLASRWSLDELGVTGRGFRPALWVAGAGLLLAAGIVGGGAAAGTLHVYSNERHAALGALLYAAWALAQEFIVQSFFLLRWERILNRGKLAVGATAALFFLAHLPNPALLIAAAIASPILCELFRRYRNIYPLAIAHALVGLTVAAAIPDVMHHQMKVGAAFFHWQ